MNGFERISHAFLEANQDEGLGLAAESPLVDVTPLDGPPARAYLVGLRCKGLIRTSAGAIEEWEDWQIGVQFARDYLRRAEPYRVLTWLGPREVHHPNISDRLPVLCIGTIRPATPLVELISRTWEVITYRRFTTCEHDCLNPAAAQWARHHLERFPVDDRVLRLRRPRGRIRALPRRAGAAS